MKIKPKYKIRDYLRGISESRGPEEANLIARHLTKHVLDSAKGTAEELNRTLDSLIDEATKIRARISKFMKEEE